jgi:prepilin-type N-terminal cleavage/methylation domain-containing protein
MATRVKAFTLIELLTVIAIIAVLAAIIFPVFGQAKESAKKATCASNMRQLATAVNMYTTDFDDVYPTITGGDTGAGLIGGWVYYDKFPFGPFDVTKGSLWNYTKNKDIYICPDDTKGRNDGLSYAVNDCLTTVPDPYEGYSYGMSTTAFTTPASMMLFGEEGEKDSPQSTTNDGGISFVWDTIGARHNGGTEIAFTDTHVKWFAAGQAVAQKVQQGPDNNCHGQVGP